MILHWEAPGHRKLLQFHEGGYHQNSKSVTKQFKSLEAKVAALLNVETRNCQLEKDVSEHKEIISELKETDVFQTKIINEFKSKLNQSMNKFQKLKTSIFNMASLVNALDNKSREKNIFINNVREQQFEKYGQLIAIVKKILIRLTRSQELIEQVNSLGI